VLPTHIRLRFLLALLMFFAGVACARAADIEDWAAVSQKLAAVTTATDFTPGGTQPGLEGRALQNSHDVEMKHMRGGRATPRR